MNRSKVFPRKKYLLDLFLSLPKASRESGPAVHVLVVKKCILRLIKNKRTILLLHGYTCMHRYI